MNFIKGKRSIIRIPSLKPGYYDKDLLMLHGMFDLLVEYVEEEVAWLEFVLRRKHKVPWWSSLRREFEKQNKEKLGLDYLRAVPDHEYWEKSWWDRKKANDQEVVDLYLWWKYDYPKMRDAVDKSGNKECFDAEENLRATENNMLKRLIDIRASLWT